MLSLKRVKEQQRLAQSLAQRKFRAAHTVDFPPGVEFQTRFLTYTWKIPQNSQIIFSPQSSNARLERSACGKFHAVRGGYVTVRLPPPAAPGISEYRLPEGTRIYDLLTENMENHTIRTKFCWVSYPIACTFYQKLIADHPLYNMISGGLQVFRGADDHLRRDEDAGANVCRLPTHPNRLDN